MLLNGSATTEDDLSDEVILSQFENTQFHDRRRIKDRMGRLEHRGSVDAPFEGDPVVEARAECLDLANYFEEIWRRGEVNIDVLRHVFFMAEQIDWLLDSLLTRRESTGDASQPEPSSDERA